MEKQTHNNTDNDVMLLNGMLPNGTPPWDRNSRRSNVDGKPDNDCLHHDHYDDVVISAFLRSELEYHTWREPRAPRAITGVFLDGGLKHVALCDQEYGLLAVYRVDPDGSIQEAVEVPDAIRAAYD